MIPVHLPNGSYTCTLLPFPNACNRLARRGVDTSVDVMEPRGSRKDYSPRVIRS
jgi:hypothetical protein